MRARSVSNSGSATPPRPTRGRISPSRSPSPARENNATSGASKPSYKCQQQGHMAKDCPESANANGNAFQERQKNSGPRPCYKCKKEGHMARQCPQQAGGNDQEQPPKVVVFGIADEVTDDDLRNFFESCGDIVDLFLLRKSDKAPLAFVTFDTKEQAQKAIELSGTELQGKDLKISLARPRGGGGGGQRGPRTCHKCQQEGHMARECPGGQEKMVQEQANQQPKLFIANLADEVTEDELRTLFEPCGEMVDFCFIRKPDKSPFAFITFSTMEEAEKGKELSGTELQGKQIRVSLAKGKAGGNGGGQRGPRTCHKCQQEGHMARDCPGGQERMVEEQPDQQPKIFISNIADEATEDELRTLFESCGEMVDFCFIRKPDKAPFAFITFSTMEQAEKGKQLSGTELQGKNIKIGLAKPRGSGGGGQRGPRTCHKCQKEGHMARECPGVQEEMVPEEKPAMDVERRRRSVSGSGSARSVRSVRSGARGRPQSRSASPPHQAPTQEVPADQEPKLFVVGIADEATEDEVRDMFVAAGDVIDFFMKRGEKGAFAIVTFSSMDDALKGKELAGTQLHGRSIRVDFSKAKRGKGCFKCHKEGHMAKDCPGGQEMVQQYDQQERRPRQRRNSHDRNDGDQGQKQPKLFVVNLAEEVTDDDLRSLFQSCGQITDVYSRKNDKGSFAFVSFSTIEEAEKGKQLSGTELHGQAIRVAFAKPRAPKDDNVVGEDGNQNRPRACFNCHKQGHMSRECPEPKNFNGRPPRRDGRRSREQMVDEHVINRKVVICDIFTGKPIVFPSGRQDIINPRKQVVSYQETMEVEPVTQKKQVIVEIEDSPVREPEQPTLPEPTPVVEARLVKEGYVTSREAVQSRSRSRSKPKNQPRQARKQNVDEDSY